LVFRIEYIGPYTLYPTTSLYRVRINASAQRSDATANPDLPALRRQCPVWSLVV
jgi:hypothetical protein